MALLDELETLDRTCADLERDGIVSWQNAIERREGMVARIAHEESEPTTRSLLQLQSALDRTHELISEIEKRRERERGELQVLQRHEQLARHLTGTLSHDPQRVDYCG
jgi:hypothetical protein